MKKLTIALFSTIFAAFLCANDLYSAPPVMCNISVQVEKDDTCCARLIVHYSSTCAGHITIEQLDANLNTVDTTVFNQSLDYSSPDTFKVCPQEQNGIKENMIRWRLYFNGNILSFDSLFNCCDYCLSPEVMEQWVGYYVPLDTHGAISCGQGKYLMQPYVNVPSYVKCYDSYAVVNTNGEIVAGPVSVYTPLLPECLSEAELGSYKFVFMKDSTDDPTDLDDKCHISTDSTWTYLPHEVWADLNKVCMSAACEFTPFELRRMRCELSGGCEVYVEYYTRKCGDRQELEITSMDFGHETCITGGYLTPNGIRPDLYRDVFAELVRANSMSFEPRNLMNGQQTSATIYRVSYGMCRNTARVDTVGYYDDGKKFPILAYSPCDTTKYGCCEQPLTVTYEDDSTMRSLWNSARALRNQLDTTQDTTQCKQISDQIWQIERQLWELSNERELTIVSAEPNWYDNRIRPVSNTLCGRVGEIQQCNLRCDWTGKINGRPNSFIGGTFGNPAPKINITPEEQLRYNISADDDGSKISIKLTAETAGVAKLGIYSLDGRLIAARSYDIASGANAFTFDYSRFTSGTYIYAVSLEDKVIYDNKLNIVR